MFQSSNFQSILKKRLESLLHHEPKIHALSKFYLNVQNKKSIIIKTVTEFGKRIKIYILHTLKKWTCLGVLDLGEHDKDNETGLKEEGRI